VSDLLSFVTEGSLHQGGNGNALLLSSFGLIWSQRFPHTHPMSENPANIGSFIREHSLTQKYKRAVKVRQSFFVDGSKAEAPISDG
jgi:hypothetical protein